ncbi:MAG: sensor histidine kinase [Micrococcaceae bacterium]|nr:sensor histidine kinase [Micrococcaceae bacterium]
MSDSPLLLAAAGAVLLAALAVLAAVGLRLSGSHRELGTDAERAAYTTLHTAALAGTHLRAGLEPAGAAKASRHLRTLLNCPAFAMIDGSRLLAWDGSGGSEVSLRAETVRRLAGPTMTSGRTRMSRLEVGELSALGFGPRDIVREVIISPVEAGDRIVGCVLAFTPQARAGLVRATKEVAGWVSAQIQLADLEASRTLLMEAEVRALRAQISPHFIYNSLNAIASFITTDPARARELIVEFADFTRYSFRRHGDFTTLAEELRCIDRYLLLERARFGERLQVSLRIAPEVLSTVVPFLSLQPLVENAVRHGLEAKEGTGHISIAAEDDGHVARVTIEDDGVGIDPDHLQLVLSGRADGDHVGLRNVDARLRQVYGNDFGLSVETAVGAGTLIRLRVPKSQPEHAP